MSDKEEVGSERVRLNLWIHSRHHGQLKLLAKHEGRSVSDIVKQSIISHLKESADILKELEDDDNGL